LVRTGLDVPGLVAEAEKLEQMARDGEADGMFGPAAEYRSVARQYRDEAADCQARAHDNQRQVAKLRAELKRLGG
jgi:hypothetical protein